MKNVKYRLWASRFRREEAEKMLRRMIRIDEERCGACVGACHEGAIKIVDGKARVLREDYCDGLGACIPACPAGAISFEEAAAPAYSAAAEAAARKREDCSDSWARTFGDGKAETLIPSRLSHWPVQMKLVPVSAPFFREADLLVAADCSAYAYGGFHDRFIKGRVTLIGCPKLDGVDYAEKLTQIFACNSIKNVTAVRMEVPCCGGIEAAARRALRDSGKDLPFETVTVSAGGRILE